MNPGENNSNSDYERPNCRFRCGRGATWGKPCADGPSPDGKCGKNPPCVPKLTVRAMRGRFVWLACSVTVLLLAAGFHFNGAKSKPPAVDPGPLSAIHAHFTASQGCAACHSAAGAGLGGLFKAAFTHAGMDAQCTKCHTFAGAANSPHNENFPAHGGLKQTDCAMCHTEHRGAIVNLTTVGDAQCQTCHQLKFHSFAQDHPPFSENFPDFKRDNIRFDHAKHLLDYFKQPDYAARAAQSCAECHVASPGGRDVRTAGFDVACARCHADQISKNELVLLRLPDPPAAHGATDFSPDDASTFMAWFLQRGGQTNYGTTLRQFIFDSAKDGIAPLAKSLDAQAGKNSGAALLAGLSPELLQQPAQLWTKLQKFSPPELEASSGWYWMEDLYPELHYKPAGHADAVAKAWLEFALGKIATTNQPDAKLADAFRKEVANPRASLGNCLKCHVVSDAGKDVQRFGWNYPVNAMPAHTKFSHAAHLGVMSCENCHALNPQADYAGQFDNVSGAAISSFKSITPANCTGCHAQNKVEDNCMVCHEYHREPVLAKESLNP